VEGNPVFIYHEAFNANRAEVEELKERYRAGQVGDVEVKKRLAAALNRFLDPLRERRAYYEAHPLKVQDVLSSGIARMRAEAKETMRRVREATGLNLIEELYQDTVDLFGTEAEAVEVPAQKAK
jgi:tryptophanyl-tRNA synthetase